jgi:hypothetical protein
MWKHGGAAGLPQTSVSDRNPLNKPLMNLVADSPCNDALPENILASSKGNSTCTITHPSHSKTVSTNPKTAAK